MNPAPGAGHGGAGSCAAAAAALVIGLLVQFPWLDAPFGPEMINPGQYFGPFARSYERFGWRTLRGVPVTSLRYQGVEDAFPYLNHPPGTAWILASGGAHERGLRLPSIAATALAGALVVLLLAPALGRARALAAGVLIQLCPALGVFAQCSYEPFVLLAGLSLLLASWRLRAAAGERATGRRAWWGLLVLACALGPWCDWLFAAFVAMVPVAAWCPDRRRWWRVTLAAGLISLASLGGVLLWRAWALSAPAFDGRELSPLAGLFDSAVAQRPSAAAFLERLPVRLAAGFGWPLVGLALIGLPFFLRRTGRVGFALLLPMILIGAALPRLVAGHVSPFAYLAPAACGAACAWPALGNTRRNLLPLVATLVALACTGWHAYRGQVAATGPLLRDLGSVLDEESARFDGQGRLQAAWAVGTNLPWLYQLYYDSPTVLPGAELRTLEELKARRGGGGLKYLLLESDARDARGRPYLPLQPALLEFLERHPARRVPGLEQEVRRALDGSGGRITRARLFLLRPAPDG